jgi:hypothetical protein
MTVEQGYHVGIVIISDAITSIDTHYNSIPLRCVHIKNSSFMHMVRGIWVAAQGHPENAKADCILLKNILFTDVIADFQNYYPNTFPGYDPEAVGNSYIEYRRDV